MLHRFVKEFTSLWKNELFSDCLLKDYEASEEEVHEWVHRGDPQPDCELCSNDCKGVVKMDENTKQKLNSYLELLNEIKEKTENEQATAIAILAEVAKDQRVERMIEQREAKNNEPATFKQQRFMDNLGIKYPKNVSKREASALINEELGKNGNGE